MFTRKTIEKMLFMDIETVPSHQSLEKLDEYSQKFWLKKAIYYYRLNPDDIDKISEFYEAKAHLYAEFNRIVCISFGYLSWGQEDGNPVGKFKTISSDNELDVLLEAYKVLSNSRTADYVLCGHNLKDYDVPILARRMVINRLLPLPQHLQVYGVKKWDLPHIDTMQIWQFNDYKNYTSLGLISYLLGLPLPKRDIDGESAYHLYWEQRDLSKLAQYCESDVKATMNFILYLSNLPLLPD